MAFETRGVPCYGAIWDSWASWSDGNTLHSGGYLHYISYISPIAVYLRLCRRSKPLFTFCILEIQEYLRSNSDHSSRVIS